MNSRGKSGDMNSRPRTNQCGMALFSPILSHPLTFSISGIFLSQTCIPQSATNLFSLNFSSLLWSLCKLSLLFPPLLHESPLSACFEARLYKLHLDPLCLTLILVFPCYYPEKFANTGKRFHHMAFSSSFHDFVEQHRS